MCTTAREACRKPNKAHTPTQVKNAGCSCYWRRIKDSSTGLCYPYKHAAIKGVRDTTLNLSVLVWISLRPPVLVAFTGKRKDTRRAVRDSTKIPSHPLVALGGRMVRHGALPRFSSSPTSGSSILRVVAVFRGENTGGCSYHSRDPARVHTSGLRSRCAIR